MTASLPRLKHSRVGREISNTTVYIGTTADILAHCNSRLIVARLDKYSPRYAQGLPADLASVLDLALTEPPEPNNQNPQPSETNQISQPIPFRTQKHPPYLSAY